MNNIQGGEEKSQAGNVFDQCEDSGWKSTVSRKFCTDVEKEGALKSEVFWAKEEARWTSLLTKMWPELLSPHLPQSGKRKWSVKAAKSKRNLVWPPTPPTSFLKILEIWGNLLLNCTFWTFKNFWCYVFNYICEWASAYLKLRQWTHHPSAWSFHVEQINSVQFQAANSNLVV